jgi:hypothetical protein
VDTEDIFTLATSTQLKRKHHEYLQFPQTVYYSSNNSVIMWWNLSTLSPDGYKRELSCIKTKQTFLSFVTYKKGKTVPVL